MQGNVWLLNEMCKDKPSLPFPGFSFQAIAKADLWDPACRGGAQCAERPSHPRGGEAGTICILLWVIDFGCQLFQIFHCAHFISKNGNSCFQKFRWSAFASQTWWYVTLGNDFVALQMHGFFSPIHWRSWWHFFRMNRRKKCEHSPTLDTNKGHDPKCLLPDRLIICIRLALVTGRPILGGTLWRRGLIVSTKFFVSACTRQISCVWQQRGRDPDPRLTHNHHKPPVPARGLFPTTLATWVSQGSERMADRLKQKTRKRRPRSLKGWPVRGTRRHSTGTRTASGGKPGGTYRTREGHQTGKGRSQIDSKSIAHFLFFDVRVFSKEITSIETVSFRK